VSGVVTLAGPNEFAATLFEVLLPRTMRKDSNATLGDIHAWIDELARYVGRATHTVTKSC
jgi:hypothetical protein